MLGCCRVVVEISVLQFAACSLTLSGSHLCHFQLAAVSPLQHLQTRLMLGCSNHFSVNLSAVLLSAKIDKYLVCVMRVILTYSSASTVGKFWTVLGVCAL